MKYLLPLLALVAFNHSAPARLGENEKQIEARYGTSSATYSPMPGIIVKDYSKNGIAIHVYYIDGKSVREDFNFQGNAVTDDIVKTLLDINSLGSEWDMTQGGSGGAWKLRDGAATAALNGNKLEITSEAYTKHFADPKPQEKPANPTQGF
jgi:hypothetical protein